MNSSPVTPTGTGWPEASSRYTWVLPMGLPMGTEAPTCSTDVMRWQEAKRVVSVGP